MWKSTASSASVASGAAVSFAVTPEAHERLNNMRSQRNEDFCLRIEQSLVFIQQCHSRNEFENRSNVRESDLTKEYEGLTMDMMCISSTKVAFNSDFNIQILTRIVL